MSDKDTTPQKDEGAFEALRNKLQPMVAKSFAEGGPIRKPKELLKNRFSKEFKYEPLPSLSCIRLLRVESAAATDLIHCSIHIVDLNDKPRFLALSYSWKQDKSLASLFAAACKFNHRFSSWGATQDKNTRLGRRDHVSSDERYIKSKEIKEALSLETGFIESWTSQIIFIDGKSMTIGSNLYNALLHLRKNRPGDYWIDAVCINQKDSMERNAQVQIMGGIYRSAAAVVVWLGEVPVVLDSRMQQLSEKLATHSGAAPLSFSDEELNDLDETIVHITMIWLLTRRWFRRLWVVQESCLARQMTFVMGDYDFNPGAFSHVIRWLEEASQTEKGLGEFAPLLSVWAAQIKRIPAMLASNEFLQSGGRWTLRDWLDATTARKATDPRDVVFAGLALVDNYSLRIDQDLQLPEEHDGLQLPHRRLWKALHVDYEAETSFVLLNLAACILSHWDFNLLFAITLRYRPPPTTAILKTVLHSQASWIPDPSRWSSRELQSGFMLSNLKRPLPVLNNSERMRPRISGDGTILFMTAAILDEITEHFSLSGFISLVNVELKTIYAVDCIAQFIPRVYLHTGKSGLRTFVNVAVSKYLLQHQPVPEGLPSFLYFLFCQRLDSWLQGQISLEKQRDEVEQTEDLKRKEVEVLQWETYRLPEWLPFVGSYVPVLSNAIHSDTASTAYAELKKSHPVAPWPENLEKLKASRTKGSSNEQQPEASQGLADTQQELADIQQELADIVDELLEPEIDGDKFYTKAIKDFKLRENADAIKHYTEDLQMQSIFITKQGYMGIGPNGLQAGDLVFLIVDGKAPYIFTHIDDVLQRRAAQIRKEIDSRVDAASESDLREKLLEVEAKIGKQDGYQLVGEAYIEGVMNGEVADQVKDRTKRYSFL